MSSNCLGRDKAGHNIPVRAPEKNQERGNNIPAKPPKVDSKPKK